MKFLSSFFSLSLFFPPLILLLWPHTTDAFFVGRYSTSVISNGRLSTHVGLTPTAKLYHLKAGSNKVTLSYKGGDDNEEKEENILKAGQEDNEVKFADQQEAVDLLMQSIEKSNNVEPALVEEALLYLERSERKARKVPNSEKINLESKIIGAWRLIFTTGTKATQKKLYWGSRIFSNKGKRVKLNYFPVKAVQYFGEDNDYKNTALYFSDKADSEAFLNVIGKFYTPSETKMPKLELDVQKVNIGGLFEFKTQGKGYFTMFYVDDNICCARGQGGGLAVWSKQN